MHIMRVMQHHVGVSYWHFRQICGCAILAGWLGRLRLKAGQQVHSVGEQLSSVFEAKSKPARKVPDGGIVANVHASKGPVEGYGGEFLPSPIFELGICWPSKDFLMFRWFHKTIKRYLWRFFEREMRRLIDAGDYETALKHGTDLCRRCENNVAHQYWRAIPLLWLERYQEALDIADRLEKLKAEGRINMPEEWVIVFERVKCDALNGLNQYEALHCFSSKCLERHPGVIGLAAHQLLATLKLGALTASTPSLHFLDGSTSKFDEAWHFFVLYSAQRDLGNAERACEIARLALAKFPDNTEVQKMAKAKCVPREATSLCARPRNVRRCDRARYPERRC
jgi:tetratricopeptide (TPR) repeat protein